MVAFKEELEEYCKTDPVYLGLLQDMFDEYEELVKNYPYNVPVPISFTEDERKDHIWLGEIKVIEKWLEKNIDTEYIAFPDACGVRKDEWSHVFFKDKDDAFMFKMVWG